MDIVTLKIAEKKLRSQAYLDYRGEAFRASMGSLFDVSGGQLRFDRTANIPKNMIQQNPYFVEGLTGWASIVPEDGKAEVKPNGFIEGGQAVEISAGQTEYSQIYQFVNVEERPYTLQISVYNPNREPVAADMWVLHGSVTYTLTNAKIFETGKQGWWWVCYTATPNAGSKSFGVRVAPLVTLTVGAFYLVEGTDVPPVYTGAEHGEAYSSDGVCYASIVHEVVNGHTGTRLANAKKNLIPQNPHFANGLTGWQSIISGNGEIEVLSHGFIEGGQAVDISGGQDGTYTQIYQLVNVEERPYTLGIAVYSPVYKPVATDMWVLHGSISYTLTNAKIFETGKQGWWWVCYTATPTAGNKSFGIRVAGQKALTVGAFYLVEGTDVLPVYTGVQRNRDALSISLDVPLPPVFTFGFTVTTDFGSDTIEDQTRVLSLLNGSGNGYFIEFRSSAKQFALVKRDNGIDTSVLSPPMSFNRGATIGFAIQQTHSELRLFVVRPRALVINFDDGKESVYTAGYPIMKPYGIPGTLYVITDNVGTEGWCSTQQLRELKEAGWVIANHTKTHPYLDTLSESEQLGEIKGSMDWLEQRGFDHDIIATPYGSFNQTTLKIFRDLGVRIHRNYSQVVDVWPLSDRYYLSGIGVNNVDTPEGVNAIVDAAMEEGKVLNLTFHYISTGSAGTEYHPDKFRQVIEHVVERGYPCYTVVDLAAAHERRGLLGKVEHSGTSAGGGVDNVTDISFGENDGRVFEGIFADVFLERGILSSRQLAERWRVRH